MMHTPFTKADVMQMVWETRQSLDIGISLISLLTARIETLCEDDDGAAEELPGLLTIVNSYKQPMRDCLDDMDRVKRYLAEHCPDAQMPRFERQEAA